MKSDTPRYTWILTRDGSPTLWNNELGESYRSIQGAFSESWAAFVAPAFAWLKTGVLTPLSIGEFGLGAGTNWLLWNLTLHAHNLKAADPHSCGTPTQNESSATQSSAAAGGSAAPTHSYFAIERETEAFEWGITHWRTKAAEISAFLASKEVKISAREITEALDLLPRPLIYESLEHGVSAQAKAHVWFHDPFGYEVNRDGYSAETLKKVNQLLHSDCWGGSYACNKHFKKALSQLEGLTVTLKDRSVSGLKRERLEFARGIFAR